MADGMFDIQMDEVGNLVAAFQSIADNADDLSDVLMEAGRQVQDRTIDNYLSEGRLTDLGFWILLDPAYDVWKQAHFPGRRTLELEGGLEGAITSPFAVRVFGTEVTYTITDEKAGWHQFGADRSKGGVLPPRPIIPDVGDVEPAVEHVFKDWVVDVIDIGEARVKDRPWTPDHPWYRPRSSLGTFLPFSP